MKALRRFTVRAHLPAALGALTELATNLRWSWHSPTQDLFAELDPRLWVEVGRDPVRMLGEVPAARLDEAAADAAYVRAVEAGAADLADYLSRPRWFQRQTDGAAGRPGRHPNAIAYFSMEFGVTEVLPNYSGGLGILAGDHLKAASDLGLPLIGVGLLYRSGYFRQSLTADGWQTEHYPDLDPQGLPLRLLTEEGAPVLIHVPMPEGRVLRARVWIAQVGRIPLLLLDSDIADNDPELRSVTDRLYGGDQDHRIKQEILAGIGGVRAVRAYTHAHGLPDPDVFHMNEGHAGFLGIERIREFMVAGLDFDAALTAVRAGTVFTTHTPVPAGIDRFAAALVRRYFGGSHGERESPLLPGVSVDRILGLGRESDPSVFNMAHLGLRLAQRANGVSKLHGEVSRAMFAPLWPGFDAAEVPIGSVTNGVHAPTWAAREWIDKAREFVGPELVEEARGWERLRDVDLRELWSTRNTVRGILVDEVRRRLRASWLERGAAPAELAWVDEVFDPGVLTVGFARRVPTYKRLTLMLRDPERLRSLLLDPQRPLQLVVAGKSHPADDGGKGLIQQVVRFADDPAVRHRIVFLPDYDMSMARYLYWGCDVWLNNPLRPLEACGTSGMKAALNGSLNLSIRDGWWDEMYDGENGWAIPTADGVRDDHRRDDLEAAALYETLERSVLPRFYERDHDGMPVRWMEMVRHTLQTLGPQVLASRMVRDYAVDYYAPAAASYSAVAQDEYAGARELAEYRRRVESAWPHVQVTQVDSSGLPDTPVIGATLSLRARIDLGGLAPADVVVQAVLGRVTQDDDLSDVTTVEMSHTGSDSGFEIFAVQTEVPLSGAVGYTVRVLPHHRLLSSDAELGLVASPSP
ncbi:alpha-glucan family phosphorylase [Nocardia terpenica]|uniref:alpha-glucan family phosphorylase n=1 Tax=Nocardia terpenica TaxID=455432 RepID=UPI001895F005|nr:alpha-glucan family phosphorylase [Nocardia terpenica]MBF6063566.1 alpha-glucan family phosphorylase [Nocardia terpenica]MBF6109456.1 alpha-glucan family phosphorylase [Nocardia terpenica]MBF6114115.1 alpha-glucan family phosphorylase [Nocardia terpenica]MBF6123868.1 alpha-glucan family phosphorylase [Nocardia terpenica]MBF6157327.1 alpha-glucan family phosphorylase [Nocardia terpenica]